MQSAILHADSLYRSHHQMYAISALLIQTKAQSPEPHELLESQLTPAWLLRILTYDGTSAPSNNDGLIKSHCFDDRSSITSLLGYCHVSTSISRAARVASPIIRHSGKFSRKDVSCRGVESCIFHPTVD